MLNFCCCFSSCDFLWEEEICLPSSGRTEVLIISHARHHYCITICTNHSYMHKSWIQLKYNASFLAYMHTLYSRVLPGRSQESSKVPRTEAQQTGDEDDASVHPRVTLLRFVVYCDCCPKRHQRCGLPYRQRHKSEKTYMAVAQGSFCDHSTGRNPDQNSGGAPLHPPEPEPPRTGMYGSILGQSKHFVKTRYIRKMQIIH